MKKAHNLAILCISAVLFLYAGHTVQAVTLTPARLEMTGDPGQTISGEIGIFNEQAQEKVFYTSSENFEPGSDEDGSPKFVGGEKGLASWIHTEETISIAANEKRTVPFSITIPEGTEPGGYFGALFVGGQNPSSLSGGEVSVGGKVGTLILLTVRGEIKEGAGIVDFKADTGRWHTMTPVNFSFRMSNSGGDRIIPQGDVTITNTLGMKSAVLPANNRGGSILPNSTRRFSITWGKQHERGSFFEELKYEWSELHVGWYTAHARVSWGTGGNVSNARYDFIIIPWQLMVVTIILVAIAYGGLKRYNTWIIRRART